MEWLVFIRSLIHEMGHACASWLLGAGVRELLIGTQKSYPGRRFVISFPGQPDYDGGGLCTPARSVGYVGGAVISSAGFLAVFVALNLAGILLSILLAMLLWLAGVPIEFVVFVEWIGVFFFEPLVALNFARKGCEVDKSLAIDDLRHPLYELDWRFVVATLE